MMSLYNKLPPLAQAVVETAVIGGLAGVSTAAAYSFFGMMGIFGLFTFSVICGFVAFSYEGKVRRMQGEQTTGDNNA